MLKQPRIKLLFAAIILLGLGLRLWGIDFGLPYTVAPDEPTHLSIALRMFRNADPNPHWFNYPSLMFDVNALAYIPYFLVGRAFGIVSTPADIPYPAILTVGVGKSLQPAQFLLGRGLTALFGVFGIAALYQLARAAHAPRAVALIAAFFLAVSPASVYNSHLIRPDTFVVVFILLATMFSLRILDAARPTDYLLAGISAGLAVSAKYNAPLVIAPILAAHFLRWGRPGWKRKEIYLALAASALAFFATSPFILVDFQQFLRELGFETTKQIVGGHAGFEGGALQWYLEFLWNSEGWIVFAALLAIARLVVTRARVAMVLLAFPVSYFILISLLAVRNDRTILPILPFAHLFAAVLIGQMYAWLTRTRSARWAIAVALACFVAMALPSLQDALASSAALTAPDSREPARAWIEQNLPAGARIALEAYAPYVDRQRYAVDATEGMLTHPPKWYEQNGFEYLIFSYGAYGRFFENRARYPNEAEQYETFFSRYSLLKQFQGGTEIRIYQLQPPELPKQRVAERFGVYAGWVELVGFDLRAPSWASGESQRVALHWRALESRKEPLTLTARLIDHSGREKASARAPLFGEAYAAGAWPQGIARSGIDVHVPLNALSGLYRLQLEVDAEGVGRVPVLSSSNQPVSDKLLVGPFKVTGPPLGKDEVAKAQALNANFGKLITLLGFTLSPPTARAGDSVLLTLYWRADLKMDEDYTVFIHLLDSVGSVRAQIDAQPRVGTYPTTIWDPGEVVRDDYVLSLPANIPAGEYRISLGLYQYPSLARLPMADAGGRLLDDHLVLDQAVILK